MPDLTAADRQLIAEARRIGPALRHQPSDRERLAAELLTQLADLAERLADSTWEGDPGDTPDRVNR